MGKCIACLLLSLGYSLMAADVESGEGNSVEKEYGVSNWFDGYPGGEEQKKGWNLKSEPQEGASSNQKPGPIEKGKSPLAEKVRQALLKEQINLRAVEVSSSSGGTVILKGIVTSTEEKDRAGKVAGKVEGVQNVHNLLNVLNR